jgi:surfactin synthase thioesterase subunit
MSAGDRRLVHYRSTPGARARLFCFPHAGGGLSMFQSWPARLPTFLDVCSVALAGRDTRIREAPVTAIPALVAEVLAAIAPALDLPFAFFGHSMGAIVAFELARALRRRGAPRPSLLAIAAHTAPNFEHRNPIRDLPDASFVAELQRLAGDADDALHDPELVELFLPVLRADVTLCETYRWTEEPPLECPMVAFGGCDDPEVTPGDLAEWRFHTTGSFKIEILAGGHFFVRSEVPSLLERLCSHLGQP